LIRAHDPAVRFLVFEILDEELDQSGGGGLARSRGGDENDYSEDDDELDDS